VSLLIEPRLPYKTHKIDISKNTQKEDWVCTFGATLPTRLH